MKCIFLYFILFRTKKVEPRRISFMSDDSTPYASLLMKLRASQRDTSINPNDTTPQYLTSLMSQRSESYRSELGIQP